MLEDWGLEPVGASARFVAVSPDETSWCAVTDAARLSRTSPGGEMTSIELPPRTAPLAIGERGKQRGGPELQVPDPAERRFGEPHPRTSPFGITAGADGNLWITRRAGP